MVQFQSEVYIVLNIKCRSTSLPISDISQPSLGLCRTKLICIHREKGKYHIRLRTDKTHLPRSFSRCHAVGNTKKKHDGQSNRIASKFHFNLLSLCIVWGLLRIDHRQLALALNPTQSRLVNKKIYSTTTFLFFFCFVVVFRMNWPAIDSPYNSWIKPSKRRMPKHLESRRRRCRRSHAAV